MSADSMEHMTVREPNKTILGVSSITIFKLPIVLFILEYSIKKIMLKERPVK